MHGPIDYIVVGFPGNHFKGEILRELQTASEDGAIAVLDLAIISKDKDGNVLNIELSSIDDPVIQELLPDKSGTSLIGDDDVEEIASVLDENCSAGLLIIEHTWAKGLKKAIIDADGVLLAQGRIHPDASEELDKEGE